MKAGTTFEIRESLTNHNSRLAASASSASLFTTLKNSFDCPTNSPSAVNDAMVATAPPNLSSSGRITAQWGNFALMNSHGTGKIRLGWISGLLGLAALGGAFGLSGR